LASQIENALRDSSIPENRLFSVESFGLEMDQDHLQGVWEDAESVDELEADIVVSTAIKADTVEVVPRDLWALICLLSVRDYKAGKLGVCGNPDCPARYLIKKRNTQRYCEKWSSCTKYAQRQYSLKWWNSPGGGKDRREKKLAKNQSKRKKP
jgi:hypothetical protein